MAPAAMSEGRTGEGRKGAREGRKESVNAGHPTVGEGLTSFWSSMQRTWRSPPRDDLPVATAIQRMETKWVSWCTSC